MPNARNTRRKLTIWSYGRAHRLGIAPEGEAPRKKKRIAKKGIDDDGDAEKNVGTNERNGAVMMIPF